MAQFVVRNIEGEVKARLQRRATRHGRSMEEEVRDILRNAVKMEDLSAGGLGTEISSLFVVVVRTWAPIGAQCGDASSVSRRWRSRSRSRPLFGRSRGPLRAHRL